MKGMIIRPILFLWSLFRYQFALKILSIVIAVTLWVVVFGSRTIEITKDVPFEVQLSDDQILVDPVPEKIQFHLVGPKAFIRNITTRIEDPIRANVKDLRTGVFTQRIYSDAIKLPMGVKVQSLAHGNFTAANPDQGTQKSHHGFKRDQHFACRLFKYSRNDHCATRD
jgi:hypothetical protein